MQSVLENFQLSTHWGPMMHISLGLCKKNVTPLLRHWSYLFLALSHQYACPLLTHWSYVFLALKPSICVYATVNWVINASSNGLLPDGHWDISIKADLLSTELLGTPLVTSKVIHKFFLLWKCCQQNVGHTIQSRMCQKKWKPYEIFHVSNSLSGVQCFFISCWKIMELLKLLES